MNSRKVFVESSKNGIRSYTVNELREFLKTKNIQEHNGVKISKIKKPELVRYTLDVLKYNIIMKPWKINSINTTSDRFKQDVQNVNAYFERQKEGKTSVDNPVLILKVAPPASGKGSKKVQNSISKFLGTNIDNFIEYNIDDLVQSSLTFKDCTGSCIPNEIKSQVNSNIQKQQLLNYLNSKNRRNNLSETYLQLRKELKLKQLIMNHMKLDMKERKNLILETTGVDVSKIIWFLQEGNISQVTNISKIKRPNRLKPYKIILVYPMVQIKDRIQRYKSRTYTNFSEKRVGFRAGPSENVLKNNTQRTINTFSIVASSLLKNLFVDVVILVDNNSLNNTNNIIFKKENIKNESQARSNIKRIISEGSLPNTNNAVNVTLRRLINNVTQKK